MANKVSLKVNSGTWYVRIGPGVENSVQRIVSGGTILTGTRYNDNWWYVEEYNAYIGNVAVTVVETVQETGKYYYMAITASKGDITAVLDAIYSGEENPLCRIVLTDYDATVYNSAIAICNKLGIEPEFGGEST